jgi:hypothetical protein
MNIDTIVNFTLDTHETTDVVNSVNSIVNGIDAIIKTTMVNVYIVLTVTDTMTDTVTIDAMIVTATVTATATVIVTVHGIAVAVSRAVHLVSRQRTVVTAASRHAAEAAVMNDHLKVTHAMDMTVVTRRNDIGFTITTAIAHALKVNVLADTVILVWNDQVHLHRLVPAR